MNSKLKYVKTSESTEVRRWGWTFPSVFDLDTKSERLPIVVEFKAFGELSTRIYASLAVIVAGGLEVSNEVGRSRIATLGQGI